MNCGNKNKINYQLKSQLPHRHSNHNQTHHHVKLFTDNFCKEDIFDFIGAFNNRFELSSNLTILAELREYIEINPIKLYHN